MTAKVLNIKILGQASGDGLLELLHKCRGDARGHEAMIKEMLDRGYRGGRAIIGHTFNAAGAKIMENLIRQSYPGAATTIMPMSGLCSYYAEMGGVLVGYEV